MAPSALLEQPTDIRIETYTPEEFMASSVERAELVNGQIIEKMPPSFDHGKIVTFILAALSQFIWEHDLGELTTEGAFQTGPQQVRAPDIAFLSNAGLAGENTAALIRKAPTLAVEIISPSDTYGAVEEKADEYIAAGTLAVWIVNPRWKTVTVKTAADTITYNLGEVVPGAAAVPGFELPVARFFGRR